jgi:hypothetical protein
MSQTLADCSLARLDNLTYRPVSGFRSKGVKELTLKPAAPVLIKENRK